MALTRIAAFVTRGLQILFGAVILGLSLKAISWQVYGHAPSLTGFSIFVGAFALVAALAGLASLFLPKLQKPILIADAVTAAMLFAGGIAYAVQLNGVNCKDSWGAGTTENGLINGGTQVEQDGWIDHGYLGDDDLLKRCKMAEANATFLLLEFLAAVASLVLGMLVVRKAGKSYGTGSGV